MAVIEFDGITKRFGELVAVDHLSFEVQAGQVVGFLGPNGAGKTTTLRMLLGLVSPSEGKATINGRAYRELTQPLRVVGALLEASDVHPGRTARDALARPCWAGSAAPRRLVLELVDLAGAAHRHRRRVLARDAPAPRLGRRPVVRPRSPGPGRACEWARPRGSALVAPVATPPGR